MEVQTNSIVRMRRDSLTSSFIPPKPILDLFTRLADYPWLTSPNGVYDYLDPYPFRRKVRLSPPAITDSALPQNDQTGKIEKEGQGGPVLLPETLTKTEPPIQNVLKPCVSHPSKTKKSTSDEYAWWRRAEPPRNRISVVDVIKHSFETSTDPEGPFRYSQAHASLLGQLASNQVEAEWYKAHPNLPQHPATTISDALLSSEIEALYNSMSVTQAETLARFNLVERVWTSGLHVADQLREEYGHNRDDLCFPDALYIYGSFSSHLSLPMGDIDLLFCTKEQVRYIESAQRQMRGILETWYGKDIRERVKQEAQQARNNKTRNPARALKETHSLFPLSLDIQLFSSLQVHFLKQYNETATIDEQAKFCAVCGGILFPPFTVCDCDPDVAIWYHNQVNTDFEITPPDPDNPETDPPFIVNNQLNAKPLLQIPLTKTHKHHNKSRTTVSPLQHLIDFSNPLCLGTRIPIQSSLIVPSIRRVLHDSSDSLSITGRILYSIPPPDNGRKAGLHNLAAPKYPRPDSFIETLRTQPFKLAPAPNISQNATRTFLSRLHDYLITTHTVSDTNFIATARVPILKVYDSVFVSPNDPLPLTQNLSADIGFGSVSGIINSDFLRCLLIVYPTAKYLIFVLKMYLLVKQLNEPYTGGIGGYVLSLLVISHLQQYRRNFGKDYKTESLGRLLITFLQLYGESPDLPPPPLEKDKPFSFSRFVISVRGDGQYIPIEIIEDPLDPTNNTSRTCYRDKELKDSFLSAYHELTSPLPPPLPPIAYVLSERFAEEQTNKRKQSNVPLTEAEQARRDAFFAEPLPPNSMMEPIQSVVPTILGRIICFSDQDFIKNRIQFNKHFSHHSPFFTDPRNVLIEQMGLLKTRMDELHLKEIIPSPNPSHERDFSTLSDVVNHLLLSLRITREEDEVLRQALKTSTDERQIADINAQMQELAEDRRRNACMLACFLRYLFKSLKAHHPHLSSFFPTFTQPGSLFCPSSDFEVSSLFQGNDVLFDIYQKLKLPGLAHLYPSYDQMQGRFPLLSSLSPFKAVFFQSSQLEAGQAQHDQRPMMQAGPHHQYQQSTPGQFQMSMGQGVFSHPPFDGQGDDERVTEFTALSTSINQNTSPQDTMGQNVHGMYPPIPFQQMGMMNYPMVPVQGAPGILPMANSTIPMNPAITAQIVDGTDTGSWPHTPQLGNRGNFPVYPRPTQPQYPAQPQIMFQQPFSYQNGNPTQQP
ncbi:putative DNA polymerase sigma [Blattamonas nauphoetae]|uniref:DNA polymerase sigma n=1 Tax=Blattamonas nauphoetae TaxID=2049346 RepID=A0ABQ9Y092_9EUKA|nr:putative DNA polymerase sigma [Blattamonas nauphoetae]